MKQALNYFAIPRKSLSVAVRHDTSKEEKKKYFLDMPKTFGIEIMRD